jgi:hypothetical protein
MPQVRFEPTIPVFERAKSVYALDSAASVIDHCLVGTEIFIFLFFSRHGSDEQNFLLCYKYFNTFRHPDSLILSYKLELLTCYGVLSNRENRLV